MYRYRL